MTVRPARGDPSDSPASPPTAWVAQAAGGLSERDTSEPWEVAAPCTGAASGAEPWGAATGGPSCQWRLGARVNGVTRATGTSDLDSSLRPSRGPLVDSAPCPSSLGRGSPPTRSAAARAVGYPSLSDLTRATWTRTRTRVGLPR